VSEPKTNYVAVIQGSAGSGKTQLLAEHAVTWARGGAWVILQDPDWQFVDLIGAVPYPDAESFRRALLEAKREKRPVSRLASIATSEEEPLTELVCQVASSQSAPVFAGYDEAVLVEGAQPSYVSPRFRNLLARRRHLGIALEICCQDFGLLHAIWQRLATVAFVFQCLDRQRIDIIARRFAVPAPELTTRLQSLDRFEYATIRQGYRPIVGHVPG